jgi:hypothetical protein
MGKNFLLLVLFLLFRDLFPQKLNRFDKKGQRTGGWITYSDSARTKKLAECKYKKGHTVGKALYYTMDGQLEKKEISRWKKIKTTTYYPGSNIVRSKGSARVVVSPEKIHYYYYGKWKYFDEKGEPDKNCYFEKGNLVRTVRVKKGNFNDSLANKLMRIDEYFKKRHQQLLDSVSLYWSSPKLSEKFRNRIYQNDSAIFKATENIFYEFGYPEKEICGENASVVPFFIISHAPIPMREKYLELFKAAAGTGQLSKTSLAFYIDKIKVGKGEKQVYGTQFVYEKNKISYFPIEDPANLGKRRAEMGLEE